MRRVLRRNIGYFRVLVETEVPERLDRYIHSRYQFPWHSLHKSIKNGYIRLQKPIDNFEIPGEELDSLTMTQGIEYLRNLQGLFRMKSNI